MLNFRKYAWHGNADQNYSDLKWLTIGQHHGLPTRLLDWTYSPLVALHNVTNTVYNNESKDKDKDGVVWWVNFDNVHKNLPQVLTNELYDKSAKFTIEMLEKAINKERKSNDIEDKTDIEVFSKLQESPFFLFFEPPSMDERIVNQYALFSIASDPTKSFNKLLRDKYKLNRDYGYVIIPKDVKWEIRDKLDLNNITERILFPGLDGLATWLKRHYSPKNANSSGKKCCMKMNIP